MSVWMTEKLLRFSLRFCRGRFPWKQRSFLVTASFKSTDFPQHQPGRFWGSVHQKGLSRSLAGAERFYSQGGSRTEDLEENVHLPSQPGGRPAEVQLDGTASPFVSFLQRCRSPSEVLDLAGEHSPTERQISSCLTAMWSSLKKMTDEQRRCELQLLHEHLELDGFLQRAMKAAWHMPDNDVTYSLLSMVSMGVPHRSRVVQTFVRVCQERLNDMDEKSLSIFASCLEHMEDSPNVDALKNGLRLAVEARLPSIKNVMALQILMRLLGKDAPNDFKQKLERKALSMTDQFSVPNAQHMISTMAAIGFHSKPLLQVCSQTVIKDLHDVPFSRLYNVLHSCKELHYRDVALFTGVSDYVSSTFDIWTNKQLLIFLSVFGNLQFCPADLMEAYAEKVVENPDALSLQDLMCVLRVYSSLNFDLKHQRQHFLDAVSGAFGCYLPKMEGSAMLKAAYCFCLLGHFPPALLEQLLQTSVDDETLRTGWERMFRTVDLCLRLDRPPLPRPLSVPTSFLGQPTAGCQAVNPRLSQALQQLVAGGASVALQEAVVVENFYFLDGVLTDAPWNQPCSSAEQPAEGAQRIAVIYAPNSNFCFGTSSPRGPLVTKLRHLKALGFACVLVTEQDLQPESEEERTAVLRRLVFPERTSETT